MGMGRAEQTGRGTGAASGQEVGGRSAGMPPVVICGWAGGPEGRMGLPKLYLFTDHDGGAARGRAIPTIDTPPSEGGHAPMGPSLGEQSPFESRMEQALRPRRTGKPPAITGGRLRVPNSKSQ